MLMDFLWGSFRFICVHKVERFQKIKYNIAYIIEIKDEEGTDERRGSYVFQTCI